MARHAVDSFYFHCAQQAESRELSEDLRLQVLRYFDDELFTWDKAEQTQRFVLGQSLNEAVFGSVIKLHLAAGTRRRRGSSLTSSGRR